MKRWLLGLLLKITLVNAVGLPPYGMTGRYCAKGHYNSDTGATTHYDNDHWCGMHLIDYRSCVTITTSDNWTDMGCDNDDGFPACRTEEDYCYWSGEKYICCCSSNHCNDCYSGMTTCNYPWNTTTTMTTTTLITTTPSTTTPTTTTPTPMTIGTTKTINTSPSSLSSTKLGVNPSIPTMQATSTLIMDRGLTTPTSTGVNEIAAKSIFGFLIFFVLLL